MKNLVKKYYTLDDPLTGVPTKDIGYTFVVTHPKVVVTRVEGVPTIITDETFDETVTVLPKYGPYTEVSKATYDALDVEGESETMKALRTRKLLFLESYAISNLNPQDPPENEKTLGEVFKELMEVADASAAELALERN